MIIAPLPIPMLAAIILLVSGLAITLAVTFTRANPKRGISPLVAAVGLLLVLGTVASAAGALQPTELRPPLLPLLIVLPILTGVFVLPRLASFRTAILA